MEVLGEDLVQLCNRGQRKISSRWLLRFVLSQRCRNCLLQAGWSGAVFLVHVALEGYQEVTHAAHWMRLSMSMKQSRRKKIYRNKGNKEKF